MNCIVAVDQNWAIGRNNKLLFPIPADLKRFRALTLGHPIIMGRKTLESFPKGPLPGRRNIVLSRNAHYQVDGAEVVHTPEEALALAGEDAFVIGGDSVYRLLLPYCNCVYVTKIGASFDADAWFPDLDKDGGWAAAEREEPLEHEGIPFQYVTYRAVTGA